MLFTIGEYIVYPMHGAGEVIAIEAREVLGASRLYYVVRFIIDGMTIMVPTDTDCGLRRVMDDSQYQALLCRLSLEDADFSPPWHDGYRTHMDKIKSGDAFALADVIKSLIRWKKERTLSVSEKRVLQTALHILTSELMAVNGQTKSDTEAIIYENI